MGLLKFLKTRSYRIDPGTVIQDSINEVSGTYDKELLIKKIDKMSREEFHLFCNDIRILQNFYDANRGSWVTDDMSKIPEKYRTYFYVIR